MLDLDAAVDLDEVEVAVAVEQELERAQVLVAGGHHGANGRVAQRLALRVRHRRRACFLEHLLVPTLDGAVALTYVDAVAVTVDDDLDLDVAVVFEPLLEVQRIVVESGHGLRTADRHGLLQLPWRAHHAHALAAATGRWLDQHRVADAVGLGQRMRVVAEHARARDRGQAVLAQQRARAGL